MSGQRGTNTYVIAKNGLLLMALFALVLLANSGIIQRDMMYVEQPTLYLANQTIHSLSDLLNVYLHPKLLNTSIPFFRPSGHFLLYQLVTPFLGWHNTRGLLVISLLFLALTGFMMIKLYQLLFPSFKIGGYIAFSLYLMQPALMLSRWTLMHFDFAYIFFVLLAFYCFVLFCQKNHLLDADFNLAGEVKKIRFHYFYQVLLAVFFYVVATTFKEPAMMLGPVMASYFCIMLYNQQPLPTFIRGVIRNKEAMQILLLLMFTCLALIVYLTLPWPSLLSHPIQTETRAIDMVGTLKKFASTFFYLQNTSHVPQLSPEMLRTILSPAIIQAITWIFLFLAGACSLVMLTTDKHRIVKKSLLFLYVSALLYLVLPVLWGAAMPWHLSLSLVSTSLIMGFSADYFLKRCIQNSRGVMLIGGMIAVGIGWTTLNVNRTNINFLSSSTTGLAFETNRNAVFHPPPIKDQLNADSIVLIEDSLSLGDYWLGNGAIPLTIVEGLEYNQFEHEYNSNYTPFHMIYNGSLFHWAYLMPELKEELYPFQITHMREVTDDALYNWIQNYNNIFCLGYDQQAQWHDRTTSFKVYLLLEKIHRKLVVNPYAEIPMRANQGKALYARQLPFPNSQLCQLQCDKDKRCKGFTYIEAKSPDYTLAKCHFYSTVVAINDMKPCGICTAFVKKS